MMKGRASQHQPIQQRHCQTNRYALTHIPKHPTGRGAVKIHVIVMPPIACRNHEWLTIQHKADMAHEALVQNAVDYLSVVAAPLGQPAEFGSLSNANFRHTAYDSAPRKNSLPQVRSNG